MRLSVVDETGDTRSGNPISRRAAERVTYSLLAPIAQSAERLHGKEKVYGSIPYWGSDHTGDPVDTNG
jgi:hypothetical protein